MYNTSTPSTLLNMYGCGIETLFVWFGNFDVFSQSGHRKYFAARIYSSGHFEALRIAINGSFGLCPNWLCNLRIAALAALGNFNHSFFLNASSFERPGSGISSNISRSCTSSSSVSVPMSSSSSILSKLSGPRSSASSASISAGNAHLASHDTFASSIWSSSTRTASLSSKSCTHFGGSYLDCPSVHSFTVFAIVSSFVMKLIFPRPSYQGITSLFHSSRIGSESN